MSNFPYLLRLTVHGIKNIQTPIQLEFYQKTIDKKFDSSKYKIKAIFGENGSGKTAIILAVQILQNILLDRSYLLDKESQDKLIKSINKCTKAGFIECEFLFSENESIDIFRYRVDFAIKADNRCSIISECFQHKSNNSRNKYKTIYQTQNGELVSYGDIKHFDYFQSRTQNLLAQQSFLSCVFDGNNDPSILGTDKMLLPICCLLIFAGSINIHIDESDNHVHYYMKQRIEEICSQESSSQDIKTLITNNSIFDNYSDTLLIPKEKYSIFESHIDQRYRFIKIFKPDLKGIEIEKKEDSDFYRCHLSMVYDNYTIDQEFESRGIKKLINLYSCLNAASMGMITFIDELDSNINDVYLGKLIEFFSYYGKGQLCFTSHNLSPMSILNDQKSSISFVSSMNTIHTWTRKGNENPENAYRKGFIEDSPFNVDPSDFLGVLGGIDE